jgi:Tfp pilus assembly protein PilF
MMRLFRIAALLAIVASVISLPASAQIPSSGLGGISRRGRLTISGMVHEAEGGRPVESVPVQLWSVAAGMVATTSTGASGNFAFTNVPSGSYYLVVDESGYQRIREEVNFNGRPPIAMQLTLRRATPFLPDRVGSGPTVSARELAIPRRAREAMERGLNLMNEKSDYRGSLGQFQRAVREYTDYYEAYMQMGLAYTGLGDAAKAEQMLRTSIEMSHRQYADALFNLAFLYSTQKRFAEAESLAREAVKLDPDSWRAHQELARALHGLDRSAEAEASAIQALHLQPDNPRTLLILANIHLRMRNYTELIRDLDHYLEIAPDGPEADQVRQMREQVLEGMANIQPRTP